MQVRVLPEALTNSPTIVAMFWVALAVVVASALLALPRLVAALRSGRSVSLALGDATQGVPHDYGDGLRRINLAGSLTAHLVRESLAADGVLVQVNGGGGGMLGGLDAPAHVVYAVEDEPAVLVVVEALASDGAD